MGKTKQTERLSDTQRQTIFGTCQRCFSILLFYKLTVLGCPQLEKKRY